MGVYQEHIVPHLVNVAMRNRQLALWRANDPACRGRVLEIGVGSGLNLPLYTDRATKILGLDLAHKGKSTLSENLPASGVKGPDMKGSKCSLGSGWKSCQEFLSQKSVGR